MGDGSVSTCLGVKFSTMNGGDLNGGGSLQENYNPTLRYARAVGDIGMIPRLLYPKEGMRARKEGFNILSAQKRGLAA